MSAADRPEIPRAAVPLDPATVAEYDLGKSRRGYDPDVVDDVLDRLAAQTEALVAEVDALREDRERLLEELATSSEAESTLKRTLVTAQRAAEASVREAQEQAEQIRTRALERAEEILHRASEQAHELREAALRRARTDEADARRRRRLLDDHVESLRAFAEDHRARVSHHLRQQLERLDAMQLPPPPPPPAPVDEDGLDEPLLERDVDGLVGDIAEAVPGDEEADASPASVVPPAPWGDDDVAPGHPPAPPPGAPEDAHGGADASPDASPPDIDELLAQVDQAAAEVSETAGVVAEDPEGSAPERDPRPEGW